MFTKEFTPEPYKFYLWEDQGRLQDRAEATRRKFRLAGLVASTWSPGKGAQAAVGIPVEMPGHILGRFLVPDFIGELSNWAIDWKPGQWNPIMDCTWLLLQEDRHYTSGQEDKVRKAILYRAKARGLKALTWLDWPGCLVAAVVRPTCFGG